MTDVSIDFAGLLCSRLCHDLLSPVGALGNGLELLADETDEAQRARCLELIAESQRASADKLTFFRLAFGAGTGFDETLAAPDVRRAVEGFVRGKAPIELGWLVEADRLTRAQARILLNLCLIANDALVRGGRMDVGAEAGEVVVRAEGPRLVLDAELRAVLAGEEAPPTSRTAHAWLARRTAETAGGRLHLADGEAGVLVLAAALPG